MRESNPTRCEGSEPILATFLALLRMCVDRYLEPEQAFLRSDDLAGFPDQTFVQRAYRLLKVVSDRVALVVPAVRDFRNLGHPGAELREGPLTEHEADIAVSLMRILIEEFGKP